MPHEQHSTRGSSTRITLGDLEQKLLRGDAFTLIDVLSPDDFDDFHLPKALNVPLGQGFCERVAYVIRDPNAELVVYGEQADTSEAAAAELRRAGYRNVIVCEEGKEAWRRTGRPVVL